ncbi:hypothetical protein [Saccharopolyspora sp. NPDC002376]
MDEFHTQIRTAVLRTLSTDHQSPALARLAQEALSGRVDLRRVIGEANGQDFERDLANRITESGRALEQASPEELDQTRQAIEDGYQRCLLPAPPPPVEQSQQRCDQDQQYWEDEEAFAEFNESPLVDGDEW